MADAGSPKKLPLPLLTRMHYAVRIWALKALITTLLALKFTLMPPRPADGPTYTKRYPSRPRIANRVFIPKAHRAGDAPLPLYIDIHGGGFTICDPRVDDAFCRRLADAHAICVVSLGYRRAPRHRFPAAAHDVAALIADVLADPDLPCDTAATAATAVGGFSAGANLAFAACQLGGLGGRIGGLVAVYPPLDYTVATEAKLTHPAPERDILKGVSKLFNWAYVPVGTDLRNPLLSPAFADPALFPPGICLVGCEYDLLCGEGERVANQLAAVRGGERRALAVGNGWEQGGLRWEKIMGQAHGFNQIPGMTEKDRKRMQRGTDMHDAIAEWLHRVVYV
jgi:acetyl esterase/lipase